MVGGEEIRLDYGWDIDVTSWASRFNVHEQLSKTG